MKLKVSLYSMPLCFSSPLLSQIGLWSGNGDGQHSKLHSMSCLCSHSLAIQTLAHEALTLWVHSSVSRWIHCCCGKGRDAPDCSDVSWNSREVRHSITDPLLMKAPAVSGESTPFSACCIVDTWPGGYRHVILAISSAWNHRKYNQLHFQPFSLAVVVLFQLCEIKLSPLWDAWL